MGERPVSRLLLVFSLPPLVGMLVSATYNLVDTAFVGRLGHAAIAALTLVWPLQLLMLGLAVGVGVGASSLVARRLGAGQTREASAAGAQALLLAVASGAVVGVVVLARTDPLLRLLGAGPQTLPLARDYLRTIMWFAPLIFFPMVANNLARAEGNPLLGMSIMVSASLINIGLDPILIFGLGPIPAFGVRGAAMATVIARLVAALLYVGYFASRRSSYRLRPGDFLPRPRIWGGIYAVGAPSMTIQLVGTVTSGVANGIAASFGSLVLACFGVVFRLFALAFMPCIGIGQGLLPLVGYNYGAGKLDRVRQVVRRGALAAVTITALSGLLYVALPGMFVALFNDDPEFRAMASAGLRIAALLFAPVGAAIVFTTFFQGIGRGLPAMVLALTRQLLFYLPALLILPRILGLTGFWAAIPISDGLAVAASLVWTTAAFRRLGFPLFGAGRPVQQRGPQPPV